MTEEQDQLVVANIRLANQLAERYMRTHHVPDVWCDDLRSAALEGLMQAARSFDPERGWKFATYATWRINGEMTDQFIRLHTGRPTAKGNNWHNRSGERSLEAMDSHHNLAKADPFSDPAEIVEENETRTAVWRLTTHLTPDQRDLCDLYFVQGLTLADIGRLQHLSESRVAQKVRAIMARLRSLAVRADLAVA